MGRPTIVEVRARGLAFANTLRQIATIIGCPADADPLTDLDGLVMTVRGLAERAETLRVVTADRDALRAEVDRLSGCSACGGSGRVLEVHEGWTCSGPCRCGRGEVPDV